MTRHAERGKRDLFPWFAAAVLAAGAGAIGVRFYREAAESVRSSSPEWKRRFQADFPGLSVAGLPAQARHGVVAKANSTDCPCGCGYTVAACLNEDQNCPRRSDNLARVSGWIKEAGGPVPKK